MDFSSDGISDILSSCYWSNDPDVPGTNPQAGYFYVLTGLGDQNYGPALPILNGDSYPLTNVPLSKETLENYDTDKIEWANICTSQHAADYDGDGDLDLITGSMSGPIFVHINSAESPSLPPSFADPPQRLPIQSPDRHSDPHLFDWDNDGDMDIVSGGASGSVYLAINTGTATQPEWSKFELLVEVSASYTQIMNDDEEIQPGRASRIWVVDFNNDDKLDLLVGDTTTLEKKVEGLSIEEEARLRNEYEEEMRPLREQDDVITKKYMEKIRKHSQDKTAMRELQEKMHEEREPLQRKMRKVREKEKRFISRVSTGHVWVYLQE